MEVMEALVGIDMVCTCSKCGGEMERHRRFFYCESCNYMIPIFDNNTPTQLPYSGRNPFTK